MNLQTVYMNRLREMLKLCEEAPSLTCDHCPGVEGYYIFDPRTETRFFEETIIINEDFCSFCRHLVCTPEELVPPPNKCPCHILGPETAYSRAREAVKKWERTILFRKF